MKSHSTIISYMSGVRKLHEVTNFSTKGFTGYLLKLTLMGLHRLNGHITKRAEPITPTILQQIYALLNFNEIEDTVFWCVCVMGFFLLFRKSNLLPDTVRGFDPNRQLKRSDIVFTKTNLVVGICWAKNHQFGKKLLTFPLPFMPGSVLCPVKALLQVYSLVDATQDQHLFALNNSGTSMTCRQFQNKLRFFIGKIEGLDPQAFSNHSLRRGGCMFSFLSGVPPEIIKLMGNWKSDAYLKYLEFPLEARAAATKLMKMRILALKL